MRDAEDDRNKLWTTETVRQAEQDNAEWVEHPADFSNDFSLFGNTGRTDATQPAELTDGRDSLYIRKAAHPIAGGLTGKVKVYTTLYSLNYGKPSADADVIASVQPDGSFPTLFVYEKGDKLVDGLRLIAGRLKLADQFKLGRHAMSPRMLKKKRARAHEQT